MNLTPKEQRKLNRGRMLIMRKIHVERLKRFLDHGGKPPGELMPHEKKRINAYMAVVEQDIKQQRLQ
ncbi:hypothetical protein [Candidatus Venteria ishoeyi]|uniref:Uncharacterized protein n=1 Tax=Candidatus Venteria ishoeyi TaxID=1899563 RepID=A0A1H6F9B3_9GAMM|nr:hypothetical protein [Candidatus Venteria ishoeyi]MDM8545170.1 hypothetical protein [Candidatus Venteria ishoeyi]SEH06688.1 Uncharacterised protein [Candidatus Venteria ishoeyi]